MRFVAMLAVLLAMALPAEAVDCQPPAWFVQVFYRGPFDTPSDPAHTIIYPHCSEDAARAQRNEIDQHGIPNFSNSFVWNDVSHSAIVGFGVVRNVWGLTWDPDAPLAKLPDPPHGMEPPQQ